MQNFEANIINIFDDTLFFGELTITNGRIFQVRKKGPENLNFPYIMPGFVDAHVHIESSMLTPSQFGRLAVVHGTVGTVSDPHEIANVMGVEGVEYMIENGKLIPFKFSFGAPSCVPATEFETAGSAINADQIKVLMAKDDVAYLAEMMNYPGVISHDSQILEKIKHAQYFNKPVDGHAPGLRGDDMINYFAAGITTDHECFTEEEAEEKLKRGVKILIREGSAAKNFDALINLANKYPNQMMFCSDDKHPDDLILGHINLLIKRALNNKIDIFTALKMASLNPVLHYDLDCGLLREGDCADFVIVNNLTEFKILETYINGEQVALNGVSLIEHIQPKIINNFNATPITEEDIKFNFNSFNKKINVIKLIDGQLITEKMIFNLPEQKSKLNKILHENDILKIVVFNRYKSVKPSIAFIHGFGLVGGAIASSVAHDSHNILAVGVDDESITDAINLVIREKGGISAVHLRQMAVSALPIAGLMSPKDGYELAKDYQRLTKFVAESMGCPLKSPFMSLSFMALLVIPSLKISDKGLFDANEFKFVEVVE